MRSLLTHGIAAMAVFASLVPAAARAERFLYRYRPGDVLESRVSMAGAAMVGATGGNMMKMQFRSVSKQSERVTASAGGVVTLSLTETPISSRVVSAGKVEQSKRSPTSSTIRITPRGKFISRKSGGKSDEGDGLPGLDGLDVAYGLNFPDRDLKPGDTWDGSLTLTISGAPRTVHAVWRYSGHINFRGRDCAKVITTIAMLPPTAAAGGGAGNSADGPVLKDRMNASITTYFDPREGYEVYSTGSVVLVSRADLSSINPDSGDLASITKINVVQSALSRRAGRK